MREIRCPKCKKLLGKFRGQGEIKCPRAGCGTLFTFDTEKDEIKILRASRTP